MSNLKTNVIYERDTGRVVLVNYNDVWVIPDCWGLAHFDNGIEPVMREDPDGYVYLKPNTVIVTNPHK